MRDQSRAARAAADLRRALEQSAAALATPDLDGLLAGEAALTHAIAEFAPSPMIPPEDRNAVRADLEAARAALSRCRRLGTSLSDFVLLSLVAQGRAAGYERQRGATIDANSASWRA